MFESLAQRLQSVFSRLGRRTALTESDVDEALREIRTALLTADVHLSVVKKLTADIKARAVGEKVIESVRPDQQVAKIVYDELVRLLGGQPGTISPPNDGGIPIRWSASGPTVILMAGLQGSGKTTTCAKLARYLKSKGHRPLLVAADMQRPAAVEQLKVLGASLEIPVHWEESGRPPKICERAVAKATADGNDVVILDTAGRLHVDRELMDEVRDIAARTKPHEVLLVLDSMTGQDAVNSAKVFDESLPLTGVVLTKLDGDTRGGAALSVLSVTGKPVRFVGTGEKTEALEPFHPDRMASRILGMGDVVSLVERAQEAMKQEEVEKAAEKLFAGSFTMDDMLQQFEQVERMGPLKDWLGMIPGMAPALEGQEVDEKGIKRAKAVIQSMTAEERRKPDVLDAGRRRRIARGSGTSLDEVNRLIKGYKQMKLMMKQLRSDGGMMGKMADRRMRKMKEEQIREMRRQGVKLTEMDWAPEGEP
ncbi:MAG: signal recognition particle protein [Planctomycetes bacterium]|nr:signal recognition particle protein [Planctomycetota bacterium]